MKRLIWLAGIGLAAALAAAVAFGQGGGVVNPGGGGGGVDLDNATGDGSADFTNAVQAAQTDADTCNLDNATGDGSADFTNAVQTAQIGLIAYAPRTNTLVTSTDTNLTLASSYQQTLVITNNPCTLLWTNTIEDLYTIWVDYGTNSVTWPTNWTFWLDSQPEDGTSNAVFSVGKAHDVGWYVIGGAK